MSSVRINALPDHTVPSTVSLSDEEVIAVDGFENVETVAEQRRCDPIIVPAYSIPVVNAGLGSVKVALGLVEKHSHYPFIAYVSGVNFLVMLGMNLRYTMDGIKGTVSYLRTRKTPANWVPISNAKSNAALTLALVTAVTKASTDAVLNRYFVTRLPIKFQFADSINIQGWEVFGWSMSGFTFVGTLASGGMAMYVKLRNIVFGGERSKYSNKFSHYVSPVIGTTLSLTYAVSNLGGTIVSVSSTFGITSGPGVAGVCALGMVNAVNSQFTNIPFNVNAVDKFLGSFTAAEGEKPAYKDPYTIVSFSFAIAAGGVIAYSSRALTKALLNHSLETLGVNCSTITDPIVDGISDTTIASNLLWVGGALTPLFYDITTGAVSALSKCCQRRETVEVMEEVEPLIVEADTANDDTTEIDLEAPRDPSASPKLEGAQYRLFQQPEEDQVPPKQEFKQSNSCGIM